MKKNFLGLWCNTVLCNGGSWGQYFVGHYVHCNCIIASGICDQYHHNIMKLSKNGWKKNSLGYGAGMWWVKSQKWPFFTLFISSLKVEGKKVMLSLKLWFLSWYMVALSKKLSKKSHFWSKNGHIVTKPRVRLSLPVVQSSINIAKIIKIIEKKGFRAVIGCNLENSAKNVLKLVNFKA